MDDNPWEKDLAWVRHMMPCSHYQQAGPAQCQCSKVVGRLVLLRPSLNDALKLEDQMSFVTATCITTI